MSHIHPYASYPHYGYYDNPYCHWQNYTAPMQYHSHCYQPAGAYMTYMKLPQELLADAATPSSQTFVGGVAGTSLSLEYLKAGASPSVKVTITEDGTSATWVATTIADGYQIKENLSTVSPGAQIQLDVADCTARLRWCEVACY